MNSTEKTTGEVVHDDKAILSSSNDVDRTEQQVLNELTDPVEDARILRRVDWRILPVMFMCNVFQFLDKVVVNYANVMGLQVDLGMKGNDFSWMATAFFIAYALAEVPQGYLLQRFPVPKVLGINIVCWGICVSCTAAVKNFGGLLALRILLGIFEAVISPALVLTTAMWYTKRQAAPRYGFWYSGLGAAQILGGLISFGAQHGPRSGSFGGWRIMMVVVGGCNLILAACVLLFLPHSVNSAKFLSDGEKEQIRRKIVIDQGGNGVKVFHAASLWEALTDLQVWLLSLLTILILTPSGVITTFSATLILGFGYTPMQSALLNMPSGVISIMSILGATYAVRRGYQRWISILVILVPTIIGAGLMSFIAANNQAGKLTGIYLINTITAPMALIFTWVGSNTAGYTKRLAANAAVQIGFSIGNIIGPQTFQAKDAPQYIPAKITIFAVAGGAAVVSVVLRLLYGYRNKKTLQFRMAQLAELSTSRHVDTAVEDDQTDRANPAFLYVY